MPVWVGWSLWILRFIRMWIGHDYRPPCPDATGSREPFHSGCRDSPPWLSSPSPRYLSSVQLLVGTSSAFRPTPVNLRRLTWPDSPRLPA
ncbi:hypothetical protein FHR38_003528 [Micromonospora polyrhachis]|uniref:Uncharacterized protein n=1 Tax=Micromonospora polyrhachis TaxID=1282883 RepID=A0A7W7WQ95_9ACTN|nr:hypothetical protein [Micromonospora polyrhachis]